MVLDEVRKVVGSALQIGGRVQQMDAAAPLLGAVPELDSMAVVNLIAALEEHFGITVEDDEIVDKTKHGFGLPFGPWLQTHPGLRQITLDSLADLKRRQTVRAEFIDELTSVHVPAHAKYYGTMAWVLMMLEQWLRQHPAAA